MSSNGRAPRPVARTLRFLARLTVAGGLTGYLLWTARPGAVVDGIAGADGRLILAAVLLVLADRALMAYRSVALLCTIAPHERPRLAALMRIFFVSTFLGTFLPASIGSDVLRSVEMARLNVRVGDAVASVLMDRLLGVASLLVMAIGGLTLVPSLARNPAVATALLLAAVVLGGSILMVFSRRAAALAGDVLARTTGARVRSGTTRLLEAIGQYAGHPRALLAVLFASIGVQALRILQAFYLGRGLGIDASLGPYFAFIPLILLVMLLPVTVNGLGTSQAAFVWFFGLVGVPAAPAFALSVLFVALGIVGNLPGAALYVTGGRRGRSHVTR